MLHGQLSFLQENNFIYNDDLARYEVPYPDEPFVRVWEEYIRDIPHRGAFEALSQRLVQLRFPVHEGMSANSEYLQATRRGLATNNMQAATGAKLEKPDGLKIYLHQSLAGKIPVIETSCRTDFETLVRVFSYRNEPVQIPVSMGGCMIKGYNNWDRIARYKLECGESFDFNRLKTQKELYQDVFLILTDAEYSGVTADMLGLPDDEWRQLSLVIRREHEATHYFTLRLLGSAKNHLFDEFIADYMGIVAAIGRYRADWFLAFMGLENYPAFRPGGRLTNYLKDTEISGDAFEELKTCIKKAAENMEIYSKKHQDVYSAKGRYEMLLQLSKTNLIMLASDDAEKIFKEVK